MDKTKYTHRTASGRLCRIVSQNRDQVLIETEGSTGVWSYRYSRLTPIKKEA